VVSPQSATRIQAASGSFRADSQLPSEGRASWYQATVPISALIQSGRIYAEGGGAKQASHRDQEISGGNNYVYITDANGQDFGHVELR
jgi:hypothetical protein